MAIGVQRDLVRFEAAHCRECIMRKVNFRRKQQRADHDRFQSKDAMQTTLSINDDLYIAATAEAARCDVTFSQLVEEALREKLTCSIAWKEEVKERERLMESLLRRTNFLSGAMPTREEMNTRHDKSFDMEKEGF